MPSVNWTSVEKLWPRPLARYHSHLLKSLSDNVFHELCSLVRKRSLRASGSKRHADEVVRKLLRRRHPYPAKKESRTHLGWEKKDTPLLSSLYPQRDGGGWIDPNKRKKIRTHTLRNFSFLDNPIGTMQILSSIARSEAECRSVDVNFADDYILDIGPYLVLGIMQEYMVPFVSGGKITNGVQAAVEATGLRDFLKIGRFRHPDQGTPIYAFRLRQKQSFGDQQSKDTAQEPSRVEKLADDLVDEVNRWLQFTGRELNTHGKGRIQNVCGEILNNAERHSRIQGGGSWAVSGMMENLNQNGDAGPNLICNLAFVNIGRIIHDTITDAQDEDIRSDVQNYIKIHSNGDARYNQVLATVFALQDGVTRVTQMEGEKGGYGMMTAVEAAWALGYAKGIGGGGSMIVISGSACVQVRDPFMGYLEDEHKRRYQWFNEEQSPKLKPAMSHAFPLPNVFPGTIVSVRFFLRGDALKVSEERDDDA